MPEDDVQLCVRESDDALVVGVYAPNRDTLCGFVDRFVPQYGKPLQTYLEIKMCEQAVAYQTRDDVPGESVPCPCGHPNHWFLFYTDKKDLDSSEKS